MNLKQPQLLAVHRYSSAAHLCLVVDEVPVVLDGHLGAVGDLDLAEALHVVEDAAELDRLVADHQVGEADGADQNHLVLRQRWSDGLA